jgi:hypothetical protein
VLWWCSVHGAAAEHRRPSSAIVGGNFRQRLPAVSQTVEYWIPVFVLYSCAAEK